MPKQHPEPHYFAIGRVLRPHGIRGELRVEILTDFPERVGELRYVYVGARHRRNRLQSARPHRGALLIKLEGCDDRNAAELLRGALIHVALEDAVPLEEGEYYHFQVLGVQVETEAGEPLGEVVEVLSTPGANDVYVVHGPRGEVLLPAIRDVVLELDVEAKRMVVHLMPGLVDAA